MAETLVETLAGALAGALAETLVETMAGKLAADGQELTDYRLLYNKSPKRNCGLRIRRGGSVINPEAFASAFGI